MGRDHTLYALVEGQVEFTRVARKPVTPKKGMKWIKRPWRKFVNVIRTPQTEPMVLKQLTYPKNNHVW